MPARNFRRGFVVALVPLAALVAPLVFHRSDVPSIGNYSWAYLGLLALAVTAASAIALGVGRACGRRGDLLPALATVTTCVSFAMLLVVAELVLRARDIDPFRAYRIWGHRRSLLLGFETDANYHWKSSRGGGSYTTDANGFRIHLRAPDWATAPGPRMFALGASSTFGLHLDDDGTWPHRLEGLLWSDVGNGGVQLINAGTNGHRSLQTMLRLYVRVLPFRPDYVLYYEAVNDISRAPLPPDQVAALTQAAVLAESLGSLHRHATVQYNLYVRSMVGMYTIGFLERVAPAWFGESPVAQAIPPPSPDPDAVREQNGALFIHNVQTMVDMCRRAGTVMVLMTFLHDAKRLGPYPSACVRYYNQLLRDLAQRENVPLIDLEAAFASVPDPATYFAWDGYHPNPKGVEFIAETSAPQLTALLRAR